MNADAAASNSLNIWLIDRLVTLGWTQVVIDGHPGYSLGVRGPHAAFLTAEEGDWVLNLRTGRGARRSVLGPAEGEPAVLIDALLFFMYIKATAELESTDRTASADLAIVLRRLADEAGDARYSGRGASLLAGHAMKDGRESQAKANLEEAITLFAAAHDMTAADTARSELRNLRS